MKKSILGAVIAAAILAGAWFWASPSIAMGSLRDALIQGDRDELDEKVDFPRVRESLKAQLMGAMTAELAKQKDQGSPFAAMGGMFATAMAGQMIDTIVTPDGLKAMVQNGKFKPDPNDAKAQPPEWKVQRDGLDKFRAVPTVMPGEKAPAMVFKRDGLSWRLVDIEIPTGGLGN